jgi:putative glutamine amidotransferase
MIKVGISAGFMYPDPNRIHFTKKSLTFVENDFLRFFSRIGVMPCIIPDLEAERMGEFLDEVDGILLSGGSDVAPQSYREDPIEEGRWPGDLHRDQYEFRILDYAMQTKKPVLGVCRGVQIINVYFGGSLYQDLFTQTNTPVEHRCGVRYDEIMHEIELTDISILGKVYTKKNFFVNSVHHQGIKDVAPGFDIEATCPVDGLVEAISYKNMSEHFILGLQWHPEFAYTLGDAVESPDAIYELFMDAIAKRKAFVAAGI